MVMRSLLGIDWRRCLQMDCLGCLRVHRCDEGWSGCALVVLPSLLGVDRRRCMPMDWMGGDRGDCAKVRALVGTRGAALPFIIDTRRLVLRPVVIGVERCLGRLCF